MENKQAITNMKQGENIPYKHDTIVTLVTMAIKLESIEQIIQEFKSGKIGTVNVTYGIIEVLETE